MNLVPAQLAALRARADKGMAEGAAPADAEAREELLQHYRDAWVDWSMPVLRVGRNVKPMGEDQLAGVEWVARLAGAGHAPAGALLGRVLEDTDMASLLAAAPGRFEAIAELLPHAARFLAARALEARDWPALDRWLERGGADCEGAAAALREIRALGLEPHANVLGRVRAAAAGSMGFGGKEATHASLMLAMARTLRGNPEQADAEAKLIERAAGLGDPDARKEHWIKGLAARGGFVAQWLAENPNPFESSDTARMLAGAAFERGSATGAPDLDEALRWYEFAACAVYRRDGMLDPRACWFIGGRFDGHLRKTGLNEPDLARAWYERGIGLGDADCLSFWLLAFIDGAFGEPDPDTALAQVKRYLKQRAASGYDLQHGSRACGERAQAEHAKGTPEAKALAARWLEIGALCLDPASCYMLGVMRYKGDGGLPRELAEARRLVELAAARGHERAKAALQQLDWS